MEINDVELIKKAKREYFKNWRKNNKDKVKEHNARYWKKYYKRKKLEVEGKCGNDIKR